MDTSEKSFDIDQLTEFSKALKDYVREYYSDFQVILTGFVEKYRSQAMFVHIERSIGIQYHFEPA